MNKCYECGQECIGTRCPEHAEKHRKRNKKSREANIEVYRERERKAEAHKRSVNGQELSAYHRAWSLQKKYGLSLEQYESMVAEQEGCCAICGEVPQKLVVDHDHLTGNVRGLLCHACNVTLGLMKEDPARLLAAIGYLRK